MKRVIAMSVALSLTLGIAPSISPTAPSNVEASGFSYTAQQTQALAHINKIRADMGLSPVALNPFLNKAAENHASYLSINSTTGHGEISGKKGYTGKNVNERLQAVGSPYTDSNVSEVVSYNKSSVADGVNEFMTTAYHRKPFIKSDTTEVGVAIVGGTVVIESYSSDETIEKDVAYPYNGQTNVGVGFYGMENPNPLAKYGISQSGFIISYSQNYLMMDNLDYFTLKDSKGVAVPTFQENDFGTWFFYPKTVLKSGEKYTASISYTGTGYSETGDEYQKKISKTWSFTTGGSAVVTPKPPVVAPPTKLVYADFRTGQYWSEPFLWAINKGLISGYTNVKNPKTGKLENWLKPMDNLTEAQFLSVMFRYTNKDELAKTKPVDPKYWASTSYQLAAKYKLPTLSTLKNKTAAGKPITRGKMAHILATKHFGKPVSQQTAVQFMYDAGLSSGYTDKSGKSPKTYASYGVNDVLKRGHIATFMKNYDAYLAKQKK